MNELHALFARQHRAIPEQYASILNDVEVIPAWFRSDVYTDPAQIIQLNKDLRASGFGGEPWPEEFIALGSDPGGNVYFTDASDSRFPVYLANHELAGPEGVLQGSELCGNSFEEWLSTLRELNAHIEKDNPHSVFAAGGPEFERLRVNPGFDSLEALFSSRARPYCLLPASDQQRITAPLFGSLFNNLRRDVAFDLLGPATELALRQDDPCLFRVSLDLLSQLARDADTSEIPPRLDRAWVDLRERCERLGLRTSASWSALEQHYRRM